MDDLVLLPVTHQSKIAVLEEQFVVKSDNRVQVSERKSFTRGRFNTLQNPVTRELTVTSTALHWNGSTAVLEALCDTRDVTRMVLIADEIRIEQVLQWKGACVDIYARRLVFRGDGCIVTSPEAYAGPAFSDRRSERGDPLNAANEIESVDGLDGEAGGDIRLFVAELDLGDTDKVRLKTDGAPGQIGEKGGTLPFKPRKNGPPTKDVGTVTSKDVLAVFSNADNSTPDLKDVKHWRSAGGLGAKGLDATWTRLDGDIIKDGTLIDYSEYVVTDVRVGLAFMPFLQKIYNEVPVPSRERPSGRRKVPQEVTFAKAWQKTCKLTNPWAPSDGEDAYPSGHTGRGGRGGNITLAVAPNGASSWYSCSGGASTDSPAVDGGKPGTPEKYICAAINAVQFVKDPTSSNPDANAFLLPTKLEMHRIFGTTKPGQRALGRAKGPGDDGTLTPAEANTWLDTRLLRTMADYAREYYGAGQRERAWELIAPYWQACRELPRAALATDARSSHQAIENLVQNYQANLDLYGNPPGWVPRFSASSYLRTYLADRRFSYRFVGIMEKATRLMGGLEQANAMLGDLTASTENLIDQLRDELYTAFVRYDVAGELLYEANSTLLNVQQQLSALESDAELAAIIKVHDQAVVKAVFDISGAVLKAIPVYQPALAGVGAVVESVGGVVVSSMNPDPDQPFDGWQAVATISGSVEGVLKENAGSFKSQLEGRLRSRYKDQLDPDAADLRTQVKQLRTAIAEGQTEHDAAVVEASAALERDELLAELLNTDAELTERLAGNAENREQLLQELKSFNQTLNELAPANGKEISIDAANRGKQRLLITRAKLYTLLANAQNESRALELEMADNAATRAELEAPRQALAKRRSRLEAQQEALDKLLPDFEESRAKNKIKKAGETAGKALEGVQRLAQGAATIATSISSVARMPESDSEEVQALKAQILKGKYGERYAALQDQVEKATATMSEALSELMSCNQGVTTLTADFASAIQSSIDISRNRLAFARGLDASLKTSLVAMQRQARQRMDYYLYLFRKAYMYEYCETVGSDVASLNGFIEQADKWLRDSRAALADAREAPRSSDALQGLAQLSAMTDANIEEFGNDALRHTLSELASKLLQRRQAQGMPRGNSVRFVIDAPRRQALARERRITLGPVLDLIPNAGEFFSNNRLLKVTSIALAKGDLRFRATATPQSSVRILFEFGRELVLWDGRRYVMFRIAQSERPLSFGFVANHFTSDANGEWSGEFKADSGSSADELFKTVSAEALGQSLSYAEINPSFLSTLSATITLGGSQIEEITHLSLNLGWQAN
ncbi:hypothetical protein [Marinobacterium sedimentorum]|uniref:hypothetical protein n=1 Tax=Marinobacterium sedimentorum TaxID=2927804 RepID=UPI0020C5C11B|nr:hypothetical protein [Marinobacterium sedimentorum]MCP8689859.1 hypothetical protein [Marinobacterium sedimentorum]